MFLPHDFFLFPHACFILLSREPFFIFMNCSCCSLVVLEPNLAVAAEAIEAVALKI